tara:strand:+ start:1187 stop:1981 length:795 start_codon:yes stop_codon:yes gene_type:complete
MGNFLEVFSNLSGDQKGQLAMQAAKLVPTIIGFNQASKAAEQQREYLEDIKELEKNRQVVTNPYANVTNPYANLQVATKAAEMQADQTDIALANTLDQLRQTGAGGATALAQAALKSKQGVAADIQRQEAQNQKLQAQGQQQMEMAQARGAGFAFQAQERRDEAQLDRLQGLADIEAARRASAFSSGVGGLTSTLSGAAQALINPQAQNFGAIPNIGSGFDASQLYNNSDQSYSDLMTTNLNTLVNEQEDLGGSDIEPVYEDFN